MICRSSSLSSVTCCGGGAVVPGSRGITSLSGSSSSVTLLLYELPAALNAYHSALYLDPPSSAAAIWRLYGCLRWSEEPRRCLCSLVCTAPTDWLCQRIPSDQVQYGCTALISSPHQGSSPTPLPLPPPPCILPPL